MKNQRKISDKSINQSDDRVEPEEMAGCRNSVLFTYRALGTGIAVQSLTDTEFKEALHDDERFALICQIYKMLAVDQAYAEQQANMRTRIMDRIAHGLVERQHPGTEALLTSAIDFNLIPDAPGASAALINSLRP